MKWEEEISQIIAKAENKEIAEIMTKFREVGRSSPCSHFTGLSLKCRLNHELDCLTCPEYEPHETLGNLGRGYAEYECGKVIHLVDDVQTDGFYRSGPALCRRWPDGESDAVEVYPANSWDEVIQTFGEQKICKRCLKAFKEDQKGDE